MSSSSPQQATATGRGKWLVLGVLVLGMVLATVAVYWNRTVPTSGAPVDGAGPAKWDPAAAHAEYARVKAIIDQDIGHATFGPGDLAEARHQIEKYPHFAPAHALYGQALYQDNQLGAAYDELQTSLGLDARQATVEELAGEVAAALGKPDEAIKHFARALAQDVNNVPYRLRLARAYLGHQELDHARMQLLEAVKINPGSAPAFALLCELSLRENNLPTAEQSIKKAIALLKPDEEALRPQYVVTEAAVLRRAGRPDDALVALAALSPKQRLGPDVVEAQALCWAMKGKPGEGASLYEHALQANRGDWRLAAGATRWRLQAGDKDAARTDLAMLKRIDPQLPIVAEFEAKLK